MGAFIFGVSVQTSVGLRLESKATCAEPDLERWLEPFGLQPPLRVGVKTWCLRRTPLDRLQSYKSELQIKEPQVADRNFMTRRQSFQIRTPRLQIRTPQAFKSCTAFRQSLKSKLQSYKSELHGSRSPLPTPSVSSSSPVVNHGSPRFLLSRSRPPLTRSR